MAVIYKIIKIGTDKCYVGHTTEQPRRWDEHRRTLQRGTHHARYLQRAWNKYGAEAFAFEIIEECLDEDRVLREQYYIDTLNSCYNSAPAAGSMLGYRFTDEQRARCGIHRIGIKETPEATEARLAAARKSLQESPFVWITDGTSNRRHPIAKSVPDGWYPGRLFSEDHKAAVLAAAGPRDDEAKARMRTSRLKFVAENPERHQAIVASKSTWTWYTDGTLQQQIAEGDAPPPDWYPGMATKRDGVKWITNGVEGRRIPDADPLPDGWRYGFPPKKPRVPGLEPSVIAARLNGGEAVASIARELGVAPTSVYNAGHRGGWQAATDRSLSPEQIAKMQAGRQAARDSAAPQIWINDGAHNRKIDAEDTIPVGWKAGKAASDDERAANSAAAKLKFTSENASRYIKAAWADPVSREKLMTSRADQAWITNGIETKRHWKSEPIPEGWRRGRGGVYGRAAAKAKREAAQTDLKLASD